MSKVITLDETRAVETPAATMLTYASPTTPTVAPVAVWRTSMGPKVSGPLHSIDTDHVVVVLDGALVAEIDDVESVVDAGECVILPAGVIRKLTAGPAGVVTLTSALPGSKAALGDSEPVSVPWAN